MPLNVADRVRDTTTTTGTGTITLSGTSPTGYQTFSAVGNGNTTYYTINAGSQWEVGIGTYSGAGPTLSRDTVLASSNSGSLVDFAAGTKDVFCDYPASKSISDGFGLLPPANGGTGTATAFTAGSVVFAGASGVYTQDNTNLFWDNTNDRLGIGTATPGAKLNIVDNSANDAIRITQTGTGNALVVEDSANPDATPFVVDFNGFVGVGTTTPTYPIHVKYTAAGLLVENTSGNYMVDLKASTGAYNVRIGNAGDAFLVNVNNVERLRIASAGQIGIGGANYGTAGQVLTSAGSGAAPSWATPTGGINAGQSIVLSMVFGL